MENKTFRRVKVLAIKYYNSNTSINNQGLDYFKDVNVYIDTRDGITVIDGELEYYYNMPFVVNYKIENYKDIPEEIGE
jgi:hypothetical protein